MILDLCGNKVFIHASDCVNKELLNACVNALREVLCRCCSGLFLELWIYCSRSEKLRFIESEARDLGVVAVGDFKTLHEAWRGIPRIHVSQEDVQDLSIDEVEALVAHEALHAYLHGSVLSYLVYIPSNIVERFGNPAEAYAVAYLLASALKDSEVHREMVRLGLSRYLERYASFCAKQLDDDDCAEDAPLSAIANAIKLLTPFPILGVEPPKCEWITRTRTFSEVIKGGLDRVAQVMEIMIEEFGDEPPRSEEMMNPGTP